MTINYPSHSPVSLNLDRGGILDLFPASDGLTIDLRDGRVWVTQAGDPEDHVLHAGESFRTRKRGLVVVQALESSRLHV